MQILVYIVFALVALLLVAMWPGKGRRERMQVFMRRPVAHRGLHDNGSRAPENSMEAFRRAVERGCGIELDVRATKDGQLVIAHDRSLKRNAHCDRCVDEMNWSELRTLTLFESEEGIPRFKDVLDMVAGRVPIVMEIKADTMEMARSTSEAAALMLDSYEGDVCMESFHPAAVRWFKKNRPETLRGQLSECYRGLKFPHGPAAVFLSFCMFNFLTKPDFIAYNVKHRHMLRFRIQHDLFHAVCAAWTVKSEEELMASADSFDIFIFEGFVPPLAFASEMPKERRPQGTHMQGIVRKYMLVSGEVQAVGFRYRATYIAQALGITGFVRNRDDGRVEMEVQGSPRALDEMIRKLGEQRFIEITDVEEKTLDLIPGEYEFKVRY